jgi:hypothetical protein
MPGDISPVCQTFRDYAVEAGVGDVKRTGTLRLRLCRPGPRWPRVRDADPIWARPSVTANSAPKAELLGQINAGGYVRRNRARQRVRV